MNAIIFDMDGVLVDSVGYWNEVREDLITSELGVDSVDVSELVGMNADDEYDYLATDHDLQRSKETYVDLLEERSAEIYQQRVDLLTGVEDVLRTAERNEVQLALVSASYRRRVEMVLERFDLGPRFDVAVAGDDLSGPSKPDPAIYEHAMSLLDVSPGECLAVEDSEHGVEAATGAGIHCVGYEHHPAQALDRADEVVHDPGELTERLFVACDAKPR